MRGEHVEHLAQLRVRAHVRGDAEQVAHQREPRGPERGEGVAHVVGRGGHGHARGEQPLDRRDPPADRAHVLAPHQVEIGRGQHDDRDARLGQRAGHPVLLIRRQRGHLAHVT